MKESHVRTVIAAVAGGIAMNLAMLLTFRLIGFDDHSGIVMLSGRIGNRKR
jgi:hypothetical protein